MGRPLVPAAPQPDPPGSASPPLPELRQDLQLLDEARDRYGNHTWRIYDPLHHRFHALSYRHLAMLQAWPGAESADEIVARTWMRHSELVSVADVGEFAGFLVQHGLATPAEAGAWRPALERAIERRRKLLSRLLHNYLFLRIPLVDPQRFLVSTLWLVRPLASRWILRLMAALAVVALLLVLREWDRFLASVGQLASGSGAVAILLAIPVVKILHELGHGYVAVHHGCRVNSLGVAFILGAPLFFVDVTDSWRLKSRSARLALDGAGVLVDLGIGILATLAWVLLPDGVARSIAFGLATVGWTASLAINLNPFMKFDGYHLLSDALELPNLQTRALEHSRWRMRELLFGLKRPPPEDLGPRLSRGLAAFGGASFVYRILLFTGIALAVYAFFFKLLGLILFAVEIGYFILMPIWRELKEWHAMRLTILKSPRTWVSVGIASGIALLGIIPWSTTISLPAVLEPIGFARVHVPRPARFDLMHVEIGRSISAGERLAELSSPSLAHELKLTDLRAAIVDLRLARLSSDAADREQAIILEAERRALARQRTGLLRELEELKPVSPRAGSVVALVDDVAPGRWVTPSEPVAAVYGTDGMRIVAIAAGSNAGRIRAGMTARFVPNDLLLPALAATVTRVSAANAAVITQVALADVHGGPVPTRLSSAGEAVPTDSQYPVHAAPLALDQSYLPTHPQMGVLRVEGDARSLAARLWQRIMIVLVRESGF